MGNAVFGALFGFLHDVVMTFLMLLLRPPLLTNAMTRRTNHS